MKDKTLLLTLTSPWTLLVSTSFFLLQSFRIIEIRILWFSNMSLWPILLSELKKNRTGNRKLSADRSSKEINLVIFLGSQPFPANICKCCYNKLQIQTSHRMHPAHSQGHAHGHSHGHGHTHHAGCSHGHGQQHEIQPQQYFKQLQELKSKNIQFYWNEVLNGVMLTKKLQHYGIGFLNSLNAQIIQGVVGMAHMMVTCDWMPLILRPFISGIFWPFLLYLFMNYKIITGIVDSSSANSGTGGKQLDRTVFVPLFLLPVVLYSLVGLRTSGRANTEEKKKVAQKILQARPYLESANMMCRSCAIPKVFRATHCPMCKICVPKFSRHSLVFGVCIGAANQLLALLFFLSMVLLSGYCLVKFTLIHSLFGIITQAILYAVNISILWMSVVEFLTLFILNFKFGLTEFEVKNWMMLQYLMKIPLRQFYNTCNNGLLHNFTESIFALLGASGFEAELYAYRNQIQERQNQPLREEISSNQHLSLGFPEVKPGIKYVVNWDKAMMVVVPQMPNNPLRGQIEKLMKIDEPKMIAKYKMMKKFQNQIRQQNPELNDFQVQQKAMMKMSEHMNKNPHLANSMKPPPEQQKAIQLQMLAHMKMQFQSDPQIFKDFQDIEAQLKSQAINPDEAGIRMRSLQQKIMEKKMKQIMEAQKKQQEAQKTQVNAQENRATAVEQPTLQSAIHAQILQKIEQRQKELVKEEPKRELVAEEAVQKEEESDKLNQEQFVDDENL